MRRALRWAMPGVLIIAASACTSPPVSVGTIHPPAADLACPAEPPAPAEDATEAEALAFDAAALIAGRACRDALARVCLWHRARGADHLICGATR